jgi:hypothetical protein
MHVFSPITLGGEWGFAWHFPGKTEPLLMNDHERWVIGHFLRRSRG